MFTFRICWVVFFMVANVLAFTPISDYHRTSSLWRKTSTIIIAPCSRTFKFDSTSMSFGRGMARNAALEMATKLKFSDDESGMTNSTVEQASRVDALFPRAEVVTIKMIEHVPLGCTIEESLHEDDDFIFISKLTREGHAEGAGLEVGDVILGVTGLFGKLTSTIDSNVEKIKQLVSAVPEGDPLTIQVARGTNVLERHENTIVELCSLAGTSDKEVQECVVDFLAGGYEYSDDVAEDKIEGDDARECEDDEDADCLIDGMMNLWADELPSSSIKAENIEPKVEKTTKPKPWSSRSSPSGTWVRDPKTGKMKNIDA